VGWQPVRRAASASTRAGRRPTPVTASPRQPSACYMLFDLDRQLVRAVVGGSPPPPTIAQDSATALDLPLRFRRGAPITSAGFASSAFAFPGFSLPRARPSRVSPPTFAAGFASVRFCKRAEPVAGP